ncbi:hypothetical protein Tco_0292288 [Tanacetum coccineum]
MLEMIPNRVFRAKLEVDSIIYKMMERRLRWFGHVKRRPLTTSVRRVEALVVDGSRRRSRRKLRSNDRLKQDMKELLLSEDMTMLFFLIINLYVPFGIPFDPKRYYKDGSHTNVTEAKIWRHYQLLIRDTHGSDTRFRSTLRRLGVDLAVRLRMVYSGEGQQVFVSHAWRRLFRIRAPLLGGVRRRMTWRQFILALGLHTEQEMAEAWFGAYWDGSDRLIPNKWDLRDYWIEISSD